MKYFALAFVLLFSGCAFEFSTNGETRKFNARFEPTTQDFKNADAFLNR